MPHAKSHTFQVRIDPKLWQQFQRLAASRDLSAAQLVRHLMRREVDDGGGVRRRPEGRERHPIAQVRGWEQGNGRGYRIRYGEGGSLALDRIPLLFNGDVALAFVQPMRADEFFYRNAQGDTVRRHHLFRSDHLGSLDYVAREIVKAENIVDYTQRENVGLRLAKRFGASIGEGIYLAARSADTHRVERGPPLSRNNRGAGTVQLGERSRIPSSSSRICGI